MLLALEPEDLSQIGHLIKLDTDSTAILGRMNSLIKQGYKKHEEMDLICDIIKDQGKGSESGKDDYRFAEEVQSYVRTQKDYLDSLTKSFLQVAVFLN